MEGKGTIQIVTAQRQFLLNRTGTLEHTAAIIDGANNLLLSTSSAHASIYLLQLLVTKML